MSNEIPQKVYEIFFDEVPRIANKSLERVLDELLEYIANNPNKTRSYVFTDLYQYNEENKTLFSSFHKLVKDGYLIEHVANNDIDNTYEISYDGLILLNSKGYVLKKHREELLFRSEEQRKDDQILLSRQMNRMTCVLMVASIALALIELLGIFLNYHCRN